MSMAIAHRTDTQLVSAQLHMGPVTGVKAGT